MSSIKLLWSLPMLLIAAVIGLTTNTNSTEATVVAPVEIERLDAIVETTTTTIPATTSTTTTTLLPLDWTPPTLPPSVPCQELADEALAGGWPWELLPDVLSEAYSESRCQNITEESDVFNGTDHGPMQINMRVHKDYVIMVFGSEEAIDIPVNNFHFAWKLYSDLDEKGICGFKPWTRKCRN